jgi:flagellar protein FliJ
MAKFQYKMQNILEIKEKLETQAKTDFANETAKLRVEELKLLAIYDDIEEYEEMLRKLDQGKLDIIEMKRCNNAIKIKKLEAKNQKKNINIAEKNVDIARGKLNKIMVERKTHEILKDKEFDEFKKELEEQESKEVDEIVSFQHSKVD